MKKFIKLFNFGFILISSLCLTACGKQTINLNDYLYVSFDGLNGEGRAYYEGFEDFEMDLIGMLGEDVSFLTLANIEENIFFEVDKSDGLSNGDKVELTINIDDSIEKNYKIKIEAKDQTYTVEGLVEGTSADYSSITEDTKEVSQEVELKEIDLFEGVTVEFEGYSPYITARIKTSNYLGIDEKYTLSNEKNIKNGDVITVTATYDENLAIEKEYLVTNTIKEFAFEPKDSFIQSMEEIDEETLNKIIQDGMDITEARSVPYMQWGAEMNFENIDGTIYNQVEEPEVQYLGYYFFNPKSVENYSSSFLEYNIYNSCFLVFSYNMKNSKTGEIVPIYLTTYMKNILKTPEEYVVYDSSMQDYNNLYDSQESLYNKVIIKNKVDFNYIEQVDFNKEIISEIEIIG